MGNTTSGLQTDRFAQQVLPKHQVFRDERHLSPREKWWKLGHLEPSTYGPPDLSIGGAGWAANLGTMVQLEQKAHSDRRKSRDFMPRDKPQFQAIRTCSRWSTRNMSKNGQESSEKRHFLGHPNHHCLGETRPTDAGARMAGSQGRRNFSGQLS